MMKVFRHVGLLLVLANCLVAMDRGRMGKNMEERSCWTLLDGSSSAVNRWHVAFEVSQFLRRQSMFRLIWVPTGSNHLSMTIWGCIFLFSRLHYRAPPDLCQNRQSSFQAHLAQAGDFLVWIDRYSNVRWWMILSQMVAFLSGMYLISGFVNEGLCNWM